MKPPNRPRRSRRRTPWDTPDSCTSLATYGTKLQIVASLFQFLIVFILFWWSFFSCIVSAFKYSKKWPKNTQNILQQFVTWALRLETAHVVKTLVALSALTALWIFRPTPMLVNDSFVDYTTLHIYHILGILFALLIILLQSLESLESL